MGQDKPLVRVFRLNESEWEEMGTGTVEKISDETQITITIKDGKKVVISVVLKKGDAYEQQNDRVVQIQGNNLSYEYALSFLDKSLCMQFCSIFKNIGMKQVADEDALIVNEENMLTLRDLALKAMASRDINDLYQRISADDIINGLEEASQALTPTTNSGFTSKLFVFVKALLFLNDEKMSEKLYSFNFLPFLFHILSYDPSIPVNSRVYFMDEYQKQLSSVKDVIKRSDKIKNLIQNAFAITYLRDVVVARFADENISNCLNTKLCSLHKQIFELSIQDEYVKNCLDIYDTSTPEIKKGICVTIKRLCGHINMFIPMEREKKAKDIIQQNVLEIFRKGFQDENKSYCLDGLFSLFEFGISIGTILLKQQMLKVISLAIISANTSFIINAFQFLQIVVQCGDGNMEYDELMTNAISNEVLNTLLQPLLQDKETVVKSITNFNSYISHLAQFISIVARKPSDVIRNFLIQSGILIKMVEFLPITSPSSTTTILRSLRDIFDLKDPGLTNPLIDNGVINTIHEIVDKSQGLVEIIGKQIFEKNITRVSVVPERVETPKTQVQKVPHFKDSIMSSPVKRQIDMKQTLSVMEMDSPVKRTIEHQNRDNDELAEVPPLESISDDGDDDAVGENKLEKDNDNNLMEIVDEKGSNDQDGNSDGDKDDNDNNNLMEIVDDVKDVIEEDIPLENDNEEGNKNNKENYTDKTDKAEVNDPNDEDGMSSEES